MSKHEEYVEYTINYPYQSVREFYPFYLSQHANDLNRLLHYIGTFLSIIFFLYAIVINNVMFFYYCPVVGYGFAWFGHFFFEKNKPATFVYPFWSLMCDFIMLSRFLGGRMPSDLKKLKIRNYRYTSIKYL